jgi:hypothetical protein
MSCSSAFHTGTVFHRSSRPANLSILQLVPISRLCRSPIERIQIVVSCRSSPYTLDHHALRSKILIPQIRFGQLSSHGFGQSDLSAAPGDCKNQLPQLSCSTQIFHIPSELLTLPISHLEISQQGRKQIIVAQSIISPLCHSQRGHQSPMRLFLCR